MHYELNATYPERIRAMHKLYRVRLYDDVVERIYSLTLYAYDIADAEVLVADAYGDDPINIISVISA